MTNRRRRGFTLMEMILVLALVTTVAALSWPMMRGTLDNQRLVAGGNQVRAAMALARANAINSGQMQSLRFLPGSTRYRIAPWEGDDAGGGAADSSAANAASTAFSAAPATTSGAANSTSSGASAGNCDPSAAISENDLPQDVSLAAVRLGPTNNPADGENAHDANSNAMGFGVSGGATVSAGSGTASFGSTDSGSAKGDGGPAIVFYPDGTSASCQVVLVNKRNCSVTVELRGLTGVAAMSTLQSAEAQR